MYQNIVYVYVCIHVCAVCIFVGNMCVYIFLKFNGYKRDHKLSKILKSKPLFFSLMKSCLAPQKIKGRSLVAGGGVGGGPGVIQQNGAREVARVFPQPESTSFRVFEAALQVFSKTFACLPFSTVLQRFLSLEKSCSVSARKTLEQH